jgi:uncharacterized protein (DUF433 family)
MVPAVTIDLPLRTDPDGTIRVGKTCVTLDVLINAYLEGSTAEEIAQNFDVLNLADIHHVIGYYLNNRAEVEAYMQAREEFSEKRRLEWEKNHPTPVLNKAEYRARFEERRKQKQDTNS